MLFNSLHLVFVPKCDAKIRLYFVIHKYFGKKLSKKVHF